jgi:hypothetical protein
MRQHRSQFLKIRRVLIPCTLSARRQPSSTRISPSKCYKRYTASQGNVDTQIATPKTGHEQ